MPISSEEFLFYLKNAEFHSKCSVLSPVKIKNAYSSPYSIPKEYDEKILIRIGELDECELPFNFIDTMISDLKIPESLAYAMMKTCFVANYQDSDPYDEVPVYSVMMAGYENLYNCIKDVGTLPECYVSDFHEYSKSKIELIDKIINKIKRDFEYYPINEYYDVDMSSFGIIKYKMTNRKFFQLKNRDRFSIYSIFVNAIYEYVSSDEVSCPDFLIEKGELNIQNMLI